MNSLCRPAPDRDRQVDQTVPRGPSLGQAGDASPGTMPLGAAGPPSELSTFSPMARLDRRAVRLRYD